MGTRRLQAQQWPSVSLIPVSRGHSEVLPAVCLLAFLLHVVFLLKGRKIELFLCLALPHALYIYIHPIPETLRPLPTLEVLLTLCLSLPSACPYPLLCPPLQKQLADLSLISCPSEQIHLPLCSLFLPTLHPAWGPLWPSSLFSWLSFLSFPPSQLHET